MSYTFALGLGSFQTFGQDTGKALKIKISVSDIGHTSLEFGVSSGHQSDPVFYLAHNLDDIEKMFDEIIKVIVESEARKYGPEVFDQAKLEQEVLSELERFRDIIDDADSDDLRGFSDIISIDTESTIDLSSIKEQFEDILFNIRAEREYLNQV